MVYYPEIEVFLELEDAIGRIHFSENSPDELKKANERYLKKQMGVLF